MAILVMNGKELHPTVKNIYVEYFNGLPAPEGTEGKEIQRKTTGDKKENCKFVLLSRDKTEI